MPLLASSNITRDFILPTVASCIDLVVHCVRDQQGNRYVEEILAVGSRVESDIIETGTLFGREDGELRVAGTAIFDLRKLSAEARRQLEREGVIG